MNLLETKAEQLLFGLALPTQGYLGRLRHAETNMPSAASTVAFSPNGEECYRKLQPF